MVASPDDDQVHQGLTEVTSLYEMREPDRMTEISDTTPITIKVTLAARHVTFTSCPIPTDFWHGRSAFANVCWSNDQNAFHIPP